MIIGQTQCFMIALVIAAAIGAHRGWGREVITCAILLGTVLFLANGGMNFLLGGLANLTRGASLSGAGADPNTCSPATKQTITTGLFGLMTYLGYRVGYRYGSPPAHGGHRLAGIIPGALNGAAIAYYFSNALVPNGNALTLFTPSAATTTAYLPQIFGLALIGLVIVLLVAGVSSRGSKSGH